MQPFEITVPDSVLTDLERRLASTRWPDTVDDAGWDYGTSLDYAQQLVRYWQNDFDWREQERRLNQWPQFRTELATRHPQRLIGVHYNMLSPPIDEASLDEEQRRWWEEVKAYRNEEWGYVRLQSTKPQTPSFGLNDSPAGLAAWIVEKWRRWSDCDGDVENVYTKDELLTNIMIYWVTQTIGSSMRMYKETFGASDSPPAYGGVRVPVGVAAFNEVNRPPRELCEPHFDIHRFTVMERGGHFPAMEVPTDLIEEIREFFRPLRTD